jgi:hypothetical protein
MLTLGVLCDALRLILLVPRSFRGVRKRQLVTHNTADQSSLCLREDPVANKVYVTGTFDSWKATVQLEKKGNVFQKSVELPLDQRVLYKASHGQD